MQLVWVRFFKLLWQYYILLFYWYLSIFPILVTRYPLSLNLLYFLNIFLISIIWQFGAFLIKLLISIIKHLSFILFQSNNVLIFGGVLFFIASPYYLVVEFSVWFRFFKCMSCETFTDNILDISIQYLFWFMLI